MSFTKAKELLKAFITDKTTPEDAEKISAINKEIEDEETRQTEFATKHEELRKKYVDAVMHSTFDAKPEDKEPAKPKSLEECINDVIDARKE